MLYNDFMFKPLKSKSRREILEGDTLLAKLLRYALDDR